MTASPASPANATNRQQKPDRSGERCEAIWICWEPQRRNRELAQFYGVPLYEFSAIGRTRNVFIKYAKGLVMSTAALLRHRPRVVFCMNPSLVLAGYLVIVGMITRLRVIVDAHNAGLFPREGRSRLLNRIARFLCRHADATIVSNEGLAAFVRSAGGRAFVLPDRLPGLPPAPGRALRGRFNLVFICSFAADEPYQMVFESARLLGGDYVIHVTGDHAKVRSRLPALPDNIVLTGFLSEQEYVSLLRSCDATIDLTLREDCLVCGAYESLALGKPMVLSDTAALRNYFGLAGVYTAPTPAGIAEAIRELMANREAFLSNLPLVQRRIGEAWQESAQELGRFVERAAG